ncbi:MAG TPA: hypothetical protein VGH53_24375 [Streptosporangiaceae bacterium]|jgi:hypothetical protein
MPEATNGSQTLAARLQPYLRPGEDLLWCGRPDPAVFFNSADLIAIPFGLVWLGIAVAFEKGAAAAGAPHIFRLVADVFVAIGLYLVAGRFVTRWIAKRRTVYGITNDRVLIQIGRSFRESPVKGGSMAVRRSPRNRHATVVFEPFGSYVVSQPGLMTGPPAANTGMPTMGPPTSRRVAPGQIRFADVANPDAMLAAINRAKSVLPAGQSPTAP